ncbi:hypothetical protein J32TS2_08320 [Shouchella clausii]|nr:hypothetical protein J1TS1_31190 [Shouchella clausii]GIN15476.1 hypothetical protein J32TS2_08320 [Shouchella clausii]
MGKTKTAEGKYTLPSIQTRRENMYKTRNHAIMEQTKKRHFVLKRSVMDDKFDKNKEAVDWKAKHARVW